MTNFLIIFSGLKPKLLLILLVVPVLVSAECSCDLGNGVKRNKREALKYKLTAIASILVASGIGVCIPILDKRVSALRPENNIFFMIKAFAENPWGFPFTGFIAMMSAIGTLMVDTFATSYYKRSHFNKALPVTRDEEQIGEHAGHVHVHTHATHGHAHGSAFVDSAHDTSDSSSSELIRNRVISQVLELGIVVHSVIIGIALGASQSPSTIKPLVAALTFHQFFEGMGLGGCISQAKFKSKAVTIMALFFSLTTPFGIGIGIEISNVYNENSPTALIVEGVFNSASAGILIYMALVDLLAEDFMNQRMQTNGRLQLGAYISLLLGAGCMSLLAKWA
ncbi:hypothetical protein MKW98_019257 [Papaver atlanticum]|uniref:Uncharacterized protein n=1 Tax=Papaver atlanticum TaxID=357466 RepID=A0AAD4XRW9_9MAGN|nr:hypothetical protein MKW98_019257 [Papaver atlanticum]